MPWSNIPKELWPKMERCVARVQAQGRDKKSAIAICYTAIMRKDDDDMSKKDKLTRARRLAQAANVSAKKAAGAALLEETADAAEPEWTPAELDETATPEMVEKMYDEPVKPMSPYAPYGGATTFAALDSYRAAQMQAGEVADLTHEFRCLTDNIMDDEAIADKAAAIATLAGEFQTRVKAPLAETKDAPSPADAPEAAPLPEDDAPAPGVIEKVLAWLGFKAEMSQEKAEKEWAQMTSEQKADFYYGEMFDSSLAE